MNSLICIFKKVPLDFGHETNSQILRIRRKEMFCKKKKCIKRKKKLEYRRICLVHSNVINCPSETSSNGPFQDGTGQD